jgi:ABC-type iron transport system FetAB ATPase subunit
VSSAEGFAVLILQIIRVPSAAGENIVTALHRALVSAPFMPLLLDNFETVWDINSRRDVVDLLQKVVNAKNVSLIINARHSTTIWDYVDAFRLSPSTVTSRC